MAKFLSNDRKVILQSAAAGVGIIAVLTWVLSLNNDSIILWLLSIFGLLAVYWCIPTWFSRNRQLKIKEGIYFNADNEKIKKLSDRATIFGVILCLVINVLLICLVYDKLVSILISNYPIYENGFVNTLIILTVATPYLTRHIYCFILNHSMNTSFAFNGTVNTQHFNSIKKNNDDAWARRNSASYLYLPSNANYYSTHRHR